ncbi:hypothetical protein [Maribacter hydrothermalis]|uniref:DUF2116 family Zn-ribbon domain-containing protein n=1 Tax=Maribacter hydrothermalis TaxID=1836467 RepID=A0A1B7Z650_9FLAO|nr:hypothetical protein [Maribacter hydrothermalis]APQ16727.1 hypothetical protein BTR34_05065 [Maribacter hydrothermalis]OBR38188.1 hypothetical protein A9200_18070 [Maribacter hydrothermalis]
MRIYKECCHCSKELRGRTDKKFCDPQCKSAYQYQIEKYNPERFYNKVDNQLKLNRKLLKEYNKGGKVTIRSNVLLELGFNPNFITHYWKNQNGQVYFFIYEYGFLTKKENGKDKYVLILWQDYMAKNSKFTN